jgi:ribosomal-protein-alanine N-acetyltransferase
MTTNTPPLIVSARLDLVPLSADILRLLLDHNAEAAGQVLQLSLPAELHADEALLRLRLQQLAEDPEYAPWSLRAISLRDQQKAVGYINCHTKPRDPYMQTFSPEGVEFGFEIFPPYRRQGFAREACNALMKWANQDHGITEFVLSIAPDNIPSQELAKALGFTKVGSRMDEVDGLEEVYTLAYAQADAG